MGPDRALIAVALQSLLMTGVRTYRAEPPVAAQSHRLLATAASLDYVLMLASDTAGTRISPDDARRAIRDGFARAVDDGIALLRSVVPLERADSTAFVRDGLRTLRAAIAAEALVNDERAFALIVLAADANG